MATNYSKNCEHCGLVFGAQRKTARFCSDQCRVSFHRAKAEQAKAIEDTNRQLWALVTKIARMMEQSETSYEAALTLASVRKGIDYHLPGYNAWWHCERCKTSVQKPLPGEGDCKCKSKARWVLLKTT